MKNSRLTKVTGMLIVALIGKAAAQDVQLFSIAPYPVQITYNKTVNLIFPYAIKSVDKGSRDILAQKAKGVENILQLKAARRDFEQTNLTAITSDGKLYSFELSYEPQPLQLNIELIQAGTRDNHSGALLSEQKSEAFLDSLASRAASDESRLHRKSDACYKTNLSLTGLSTGDDVIFFRLDIGNQSNISYQIESLRFFISDKKRAKRTAAQQTEIIPLHVHGKTERIAARQAAQLVFALPKFTIPASQQLSIELLEKNGGRHLHLLVQNKAIIRAKPIL